MLNIIRKFVTSDPFYGLTVVEPSADLNAVEEPVQDVVLTDCTPKLRFRSKLQREDIIVFLNLVRLKLKNARVSVELKQPADRAPYLQAGRAEITFFSKRSKFAVFVDNQKVYTTKDLNELIAYFAK